jgi:rubredoxin
LSLRELTRRVPAICQRYYNQFTLGPTYSHSAGQTHAESRQAQADGAYSAAGTDTPVFECSACLTRYDARYGDARQAIAAGVPFESLPDDYECAVCGAPRKIFRPLQSLYDNQATQAVAETLN